VAEDNAELRERCHIESDLHERLSMAIWDESRLHLGTAMFRPLYAEECEELGYSDEDGAILLRRKSDGAVFEIDLDVTARKTSHVLADAD